MDPQGLEWARNALLEQRGSLVQYNVGGNAGRQARNRAEQLWPRTKEILRRFAPEYLGVLTPGHRAFPATTEVAINVALGVIEHEAEIAEHLGPTGPVLTAAGLHPWVWESAAPLWGVAHQDAVNAAARAVNARLRSKTGSVLNDVDLTNQVFSNDEPKPDRVRLRFPGVRDETWTSRMNGARGLGQACFQGIRNVGSHEETDWSEQEALEYLSMFSVLARWIEECEVERQES